MDITLQEARPLFPLLAQSTHQAPDPMALNLQVGLMVTSAVNVAVQLGLADLLDTPQRVEALAQVTKTHASSLFLLLRALASIDIFQEVDVEAHLFGNTARSLLLKADAMADLVTLWGAPYQWNSWRDLIHTIRTGKPAMQMQDGPNTTLWTYLQTHPLEQQAFQRGLTANSTLILPAILDQYDFSTFHHLVDVGGGQGHLAVSLLQHYPHLTATLFERVSIIEQAQDLIDGLPEEITARYFLVAGSFFEAETLPRGADGYLLKNVLMDWSDADYLQILRGCHAALPLNTGRLLVIEPVISADASFTTFFSLQMAMMMKAAQHRSIEAHRVLFEAAGFHLIQARPLGLEQFLLEGRPYKEMVQ